MRGGWPASMGRWAARGVLAGLLLYGASVLGAARAVGPAPARRAVPLRSMPRRGPGAPGTPPSLFGKLTSRRWAYGVRYRRQSLAPVPNPDPAPEPQPVRAHPFDVAVSPDGTRVYVGLEGSELHPGSQVVVYSLVRGRIVKRIRLQPPGVAGLPGSSPYRLTMHPAGRFLFVTNRFSNFASVIDTRTDTVVKEVPLDFYCQGTAFDRTGRRAWVANRYLDQVFTLDVHATAASFQASMRVLGGLDVQTFRGRQGRPGIHAILRRTCGTRGCHDETRGGFYAGPDARESLLSAVQHIHPGDAAGSRLLRAVVRTRDGGYADALPAFRSHARGTVGFGDPAHDADYQAIARWIDAASEGPGIPVGNPRSKPKVLALSPDGRYLFVGNTGTQDISIVDTARNREVGDIYVQNVVNDLKLYHSPVTRHDYLLVTTEGLGFGVAPERDPFGGESRDRSNAAAQFTVWRDPVSGRTLPRAAQQVLGPYDAVDGTAAIKFRDIQNDLVMVDVSALHIPPPPARPGPLPHLLRVNRYEAHRNWVRYTSEDAESTYGDVKGDIPPDLMRVVGALPEKMAVVGDRLYVTMQGTNQVQEWRINPTAVDPSNFLVPRAVYQTGMQPVGIAAGPPGTPAWGKIFVANFLGGSLSIIDVGGSPRAPDLQPPGREQAGSREVVVDPSVERLPVPATNAERGEVFVHTALFSSDRDTSCFHCHYLDMGDGRPWGVSQVVGQEFFSPHDTEGNLVIGGTMTVPQMRNLFATQPFFLEGVLSAFEPRSMIMEHAPAEDFTQPNPQGDFTAIVAHRPVNGVSDIQSSTTASTGIDATLEERRDEMFRRLCMRYFGKAFALRDFQRFVGEWQIHEPRLLPNPFDATSRSVLRGRKIFADPQVGCISCHVPPSFTRKDLPHNPVQAIPALVPLTLRDVAFTLIGMNRLDFINGFRRDLEPWDAGRIKRKGQYTIFPLRGIWDRPPVFLHNGMARSLHEVVCTPGHAGLRTFKYQPWLGGAPERPGRREVGFNTTCGFAENSPRSRLHMEVRSRIGIDTHGGTSQLTPREIDDLVDYLNSLQ